MESFIVDKPFYDIGASDLRDLWDSDLDPAMNEVLGVEAELQDWGPLLDVKPQVILHDRLMTDALGALPIKTEHSYSLTSDGDSIPDSPLSLDNKMEDIEEECFPSLSTISSSSSRDADLSIIVKDEPPGSPDSCPMSPSSPPPVIQTEIRKEQKAKKKGSQHSILKQPAIVLTSRGSIYSTQKMMIPKLNIKIEPSTSGFSLPPTPPSSTTSDSEGNISPEHNPVSPNARHVRQQRLFLAASNRQPIQTPLISSQPKGSTGMLILTDEEKRTLQAEGYPIPTRLPLTKAEEKSLKKIRRKIKNKISAQESRRKKKEYMDSLERKVEILTNENSDYKRKIESLEDSNASLLSQLQKLQAIIARTTGGNLVSRQSNISQHSLRNVMK